jgi:phage tail-like protein
MDPADRALLNRYANLAGGWAGLAGVGVDAVGDSADLALQQIPDAGIAGGPDVMPPADAAPAGVAIDPCGTGFVSVPDSGRVLRITRCAPTSVPAGEVPGSRAVDTVLLPGAFTTPRGLLLGPRGRLYVADAEAVVVVDIATGTITARWADVVAGWCLATAQGGVYLLDRGAADGRGRVRRFSAEGLEDNAFGVAAAAALSADPVRMTVAGDRLLVVTRGAAGDAVVPLGQDGTLDPVQAGVWAAPVRTERNPTTGAPIVSGVTGIDGIGADTGRVYLVEHARGDLLTFDESGRYIGSTRPERPLADMWSAGAHVLWAYPRDPGPLSRHDTAGAWLRSGTFVCGPLETGTAQDIREIRARFDCPPGGHVQLFTAVTAGDVAPSPDTVPISATASGTWTGLPVDVSTALVAEPAGPRLWVGGHLSGDGTATPVVHQIGVGGARSWLDHLPAVYRKDAAGAEFLDRYLRLLRSVQHETTQERIDLVRRFDAWTADDTSGRTGTGTALDDLAGWLTVVLDERWTESLRRQVIANEFAAQGMRGTPEGLYAAVAELYPRLRVQISEPAQRAHIWVLPADDAPVDGVCGGGLGFDTMLAAAPAGGAVLGVDAVVEQSTLIGQDAGSPLFADLAHRFHVSVVPDPGRDTTTLDAELRSLIDAQKPAHTVYTMCVAGPRARVGVQARLGVDAILAGPAPQLDLDADPGLGDASLGGPRGIRHEPTPILVGQIRLGQGRLT